mgnify:CR=1 FL=1
MWEIKKFEISHHFSKLENLQSEKTLTYSLLYKGGNTLISLKETTSDKKIYVESCLLPETDFAYAENVAVLMCENCVDIYTWKNLLEDIGIKYIVTEPNA